ncbi:unnamed protein product [Blepharisma stoltei]|uniref:Uncharacterized protein n=1 Tax=Blepharisma stoltei TaxID=1481888 RepID=A0AAU9JR44_9CILI|nr:unnamed protein product [Blepharisma stoltei]
MDIILLRIILLVGEHITYSLFHQNISISIQIYIFDLPEKKIPISLPFRLILKSTVQILLISLFTIINSAFEFFFQDYSLACFIIFNNLNNEKPLNYDNASLWYIIIIIN